MFKVLVADPIAEQGIDIFKKEKDIQTDVKLKLKPEELKAIIGEYDALAVRSETKVTADILDAAKKMKVIGRAGVGVDNIDVPAASKKGIIVMNTPDGNTISTAEHTLSMMLSLCRNIPQADASMKSGKWDRKKYTGVELYGKVLGVVGLGRVGKEVAMRAKSFGMEILAFDPYLTEEKASKLEIRAATLEEVITKSDFLTVHTPLTKETKYIISEKEISKMKEGVRIINCARGGIIKETALLEALESGKAAGAAIDVFETEPMTPEHPFIKAPNIILTPHLGASTEEAQISVAVAVAVQMIEALRGGTVRNAVNAPAIPAEILNQLQPYIILLEKMGKIAAQIADGYIKAIKIEYTGQITDYNTSCLTLSAVKGVLSSIEKDGTVNFVNAPVLLKEKNIVVSESKSNEMTSYANLIRLEITTDKGTEKIAGTVFGKNNIRIVQLSGYDIDLEPALDMLLIMNYDKPGLVGNVGTILGKEKINIASLQMARKTSGGDAITVLTVDHEIGDKVLSELAAIENVKNVKFIQS
jgi:D-3-phosphoglycerate dehydrogenase